MCIRHMRVGCWRYKIFESVQVVVIWDSFDVYWSLRPSFSTEGTVKMNFKKLLSLKIITFSFKTFRAFIG